MSGVWSLCSARNHNTPNQKNYGWNPILAKLFQLHALGQVIYQFLRFWDRDSSTWFSTAPKVREISSVQFSRSVVSDSATPCIAARQASLSITNSWSYSYSCPYLLIFMSIELVISSSVVPFSSWPQSLPASGSFPMSQLFSRGGHVTCQLYLH